MTDTLEVESTNTINEVVVVTDPEIFMELVTAAQTNNFVTEREKGETDKDYLIRLGRAVSEVDEKVWEGLSLPAQEWYNVLARTINNVKPVITVPKGFVKEDKSLDVVIKPPKIEAKNAPREITTPPEKRQTKGISECIREIVIDHMDYTGEQIKAELIAKGWEDAVTKMSSITTIRADTLAVMRIAQKLGYKKG